MAGRLTDLQAVNMMLSAVGIRQVSSVSAETGSDDASDALRTLYRYNTIVQSRGWPCNTLKGVAYTASDVGGGVYNISFTTILGTGSKKPLRVECVAPGRYRGNIELIGDTAVIASENTKDFGSAVSIYVDLVWELDFEDEVPADLQYVIVQEATKAFQMDRRANQLLDMQLQEQVAKAEVSANRGRGPNPTDVHVNDRPLVSGSAPRQ